MFLISKLKAKFSTISYSEEFKITCTNSGGSADLTGLVVSETFDCSNTLTSNPSPALGNIHFDYDSSSTSYDVSADFMSIFNSGTSTVDWDTHF